MTLGTLLQQEKANAVFYLTPINCALAKEAFGPEFERGVNKNIALLQTEMKKRGFTVLDLTCALGPDHFLDTEHLLESGRRFIADELADHVKQSGKLLPVPVGLGK